MKKKLSPDIIEKAEEIANRGNIPLGEIEDRCDYIVNYIFDKYNFSSNWWFPDAEPGSLGNFFQNHDEDFVSIELNSIVHMKILLRGGKECDLKNHFPTRWLFEDFEEEFLSGKKFYEDKLMKKSGKTKSKKAYLIASIKSKLTKEELQIIKKALV